MEQISCLMNRKCLNHNSNHQFIKIINCCWPKEKHMNAKQAKNIPIEEWLHSIGYAPTAQKGDSLWYLSPLRTETEASFKLNTTRNQWYDFGIGQGGDLVTLVCLLYHTSVSGALKILDHAPTAPLSFSFGQQKSSLLTEPYRVEPLRTEALLNYIESRGISRLIGQAHCREIHYTHLGRQYFAIGFANRSGGYELRNRYMKRCIGIKDMTIVANEQARCCIFEGFFDYLSFLQLCTTPIAHDYIILNSTSMLAKAIEILAPYDKIHAYLDNDPTGQHATAQLIEKFGSRIIDHAPNYYPHKDVNEYPTKQP